MQRTRSLFVLAFFPLLLLLTYPAHGRSPNSLPPARPATTADTAADFPNLVASFGNVNTIAGIHLATTTNPDGSDINEWTAASENALAKTTALSNPHAAAADAYGNVYIADKVSHSILKVTPDGRIHTFAGTHVAGFNGDGPAPATTLQVNSPNGLYVFPDGTVFLLDPGNHRIRRVGPDGIMTTVVNDPDPNWKATGRALWVQPDEKLIYYTNEYAVAVGGGARGACVKRWTPVAGIELLCNKAVGFSNPGNLDVNPVDGKLYVCDRGEDDNTNTAVGLWRIDGVNQRTRMTANKAGGSTPADNKTALSSYIDQVRGVAFLQDGSYFLCGHKDGNIWYVDPAGLLHKYLQGSGSKDDYTLPDNMHPPLVGQNYFAQPREVTIAPNGNLIAVSNDSGFVFVVTSVAPQPLPTDLHPTSATAAQGTQLAWTSLAGHTYVVERATNLATADWQIIGAVKATGTFATFTDTGANTAKAFYRLSPPR